MRTKIISALLGWAVIGVMAGSVAAAQPTVAQPTVTQLTATKPADAPVPKMEVQLISEAEPGHVVAIIGVKLPEEQPLPATVRIPVIAGTTVTWAGEIMGAGASSDIEREFEIRDGEGGTFAEFEVRSSRDAQIEMSGIALTQQGPNTTAAITFVQTAPSSETGFSVRVPATAANATFAPPSAGRPQVGTTGEQLYTLQTEHPALGESVALSISYGRKAAGTASGAGGSASTGLLALLAAGLVFSVIALVFVINRERNSA